MIVADKEIWKIIKEFPRYEVSSFGRVRNLRTKYILKPQKRQYLTVMLYSNGLFHRKLVHGLVAKSFLGDKSDKLEVNHKDTNHYNNNLYNLEWISHKKNVIHSYDNGRIGFSPNTIGIKNPNHILTESQVIKIRNLYKGNPGDVTKLAKRFSVNYRTISNIINNISWRHLL